MGTIDTNIRYTIIREHNIKYMGSKRRMAKYILPYIEYYRKKNQHEHYVEPFCGGCNLIDKVKGLRIANDVNSYLISMFIALQKGWIPPENVNEELYNKVRYNKDDYAPELVSFIGFNCSFGGSWFESYARDTDKSNYAKRGKANLLKQMKGLRQVVFKCKNYIDLSIPSNSLIYCDPPYQGTRGYKYKINYVNFWQWCRDKTKEGHTVLISSYQSPEDFKSLLCVNTPIRINQHNPNAVGIRAEKLFKYKGL